MRFLLAICFFGALFRAFGQDIRLYHENGTWGYTQQGRLLIKAQYDTAFAFNKDMGIAMVADKSAFSVANPLTGEEQQGYDYYFINAHNQKIKILAAGFPDSVSVFRNQEELAGNYMEASPVFSILFNHKVYLVSKQGRQLSAGYDRIYPFARKDFFVLENYSGQEESQVRHRGLTDTTGKLLVKCHCGSLKINPDDSVLYCCTAMKGAGDEVYAPDGKLLHADKRHIEFASRHYSIYREYAPDRFIYEGSDGKTKAIAGHAFVYLRHQQALVVDQQEWFVLDLLTLKKTKVNKEEYFKKLVPLYYEIPRF